MRVCPLCIIFQKAFLRFLRKVKNKRSVSKDFNNKRHPPPLSFLLDPYWPGSNKGTAGMAPRYMRDSRGRESSRMISPMPRSSTSFGVNQPVWPMVGCKKKRRN